MRNARMRREIAFVSHSFCARDLKKKKKKKKSAFTSSDYARGRLYRPISCQLTYKGTNCLSNLKGAGDVTREECARSACKTRGVIKSRERERE